MRFFGETHIDFIGKRQILALVSAVIITVGIIATIVLKPVLGIDFAGGTEIGVKFKENVTTEQLRILMAESGFESTEIKTFGGNNQFLIRVKSTGDDVDRIPQILMEKFPDFTIDEGVIKIDKVGPRIGSELYFDALLAVIIAIIFILIYIAFRFEFAFGLGAIVALVHDVLLTFSLVVIGQHFLPIGLELNQAIFAGLLTVVGYSINDTVIIFDRIRENTERHRGMTFPKMVNTSINETLSRTVNTTLTTTMVLLILLFFGGPVMQGFAFTMFIGIVTGTYSSIYIASSFVIYYNQKVKKIDYNAVVKKKSTRSVRV